MGWRVGRLRPREQSSSAVISDTHFSLQLLVGRWGRHWFGRGSHLYYLYKVIFKVLFLCFSGIGMFMSFSCRITGGFHHALSVFECILTLVFVHLLFQLVWVIPVPMQSVLPTGMVCTCVYIVCLPPCGECSSNWCDFQLCLCSFLGLKGRSHHVKDVQMHGLGHQSES